MEVSYAEMTHHEVIDDLNMISTWAARLALSFPQHQAYSHVKHIRRKLKLIEKHPTVKDVAREIDEMIDFIREQETIDEHRVYIAEKTSLLSVRLKTNYAN